MQPSDKVDPYEVWQSNTHVAGIAHDIAQRPPVHRLAGSDVETTWWSSHHYASSQKPQNKQKHKEDKQTNFIKLYQVSSNLTKLIKTLQI